MTRAKFFQSVGKRAAYAIPVIFILITAVFFIMAVLPGDPATVLLGDKATDQELERMRELMGFNRPLHIQYFDYLRKVVTGDFGRTATYEPVMLRISVGLGPTIELAFAGMFMGLIIGIPAGLIAALKQGGKVDRILRFFVLTGYSIPVFALGLIIQLVFSLYLGIFPSSGLIESSLRPDRITGLFVVDSLLALNFPGVLSSLYHLFLPALTLGLVTVPPIAGLTRENTIKALSEDYITMSRAMGIPKNKILYKHAFRNALLPLVTYVGFRLAGLFGGAVLIEVIFSRPGLGNLLVNAIMNRDYFLIQGLIAYLAIVIAVMGIIIDISYVFIDPRVKD